MRLASITRTEPAAPSAVVAAALAYARRHRERFVAEPGEFVRFESVRLLAELAGGVEHES